MSRYAVLWLPSESVPTTRGEMLGRGSAARGTPVRMTGENWDGKQAAEAAQSPEVIAARCMPVNLIAPTSTSAGAAADSWGIEAIGADRSPYDGGTCRVAVLDTGIDKDHPAFAAIDDLRFEDFTGEGNGDLNGHGTHCAGTIFGRDVGGRRIGVARGVRSVRIGKVLNRDGAGDSIAIHRGLTWALEQQANVISMSIGFDFPGLVAQLIADGWPPELATSDALVAYYDNLKMFEALRQRAEAKIFGKSPLVIAAAGNESRREDRADFRIAPSMPASVFNLAVGAVGWDGGRFKIADFSNAPPNVVAPGVDIVSAAPGGGLATMSGTSMACPHAAGVAAMFADKLVAEREPVEADGLRSYLVSTTRRDRIVGFDVDGPTEVGRGLITAPA